MVAGRSCNGGWSAKALAMNPSDCVSLAGSGVFSWLVDGLSRAVESFSCSSCALFSWLVKGLLSMPSGLAELDVELLAEIEFLPGVFGRELDMMQTILEVRVNDDMDDGEELEISQPRMLRNKYLSINRRKDLSYLP